MVPFIFWIASYIKKHSADIAQRILTHLGPFSCLLRIEQKAGKESWRHTEKHRENTATQREKLPIKAAHHRGPIRNSCSYTLRQKNDQQNVSKFYFSNMLFGCKITQFCSLSLPKNKADWRGRKTFKCSTVSKSSVSENQFFRSL